MICVQVINYFFRGVLYVEFCYLVLQCVDGYDQQDSFSFGISQEYVYKGDYLDGFIQFYVVGQDIVEVRVVVEFVEGFNQIVVQEAYFIDLRKENNFTIIVGKKINLFLKFILIILKVFDFI